MIIIAASIPTTKALGPKAVNVVKSYFSVSKWSSNGFSNSGGYDSGDARGSAYLREREEFHQPSQELAAFKPQELVPKDSGFSVGMATHAPWTPLSSHEHGRGSNGIKQSMDVSIEYGDRR